MSETEAHSGGGIARRGLLVSAAAAGLLLLAACAPERPEAGALGTPSPRITAPTSTAAPTPTPAATPTPTPTPLPDPAAVAARYASAAPTAWGMDVAGVRSVLLTPTSPAGAPRVALTFDACGGSRGIAVDANLIAGLRAGSIPATLFLNSRWIQANPQLAAELASDPLFVLGNHGTAHVPLSVTGRAAYGIPGTRSAQEVVDEVWGNHELLTTLTGSPPRLFRAGTAHYDDVAARIVADLGETPIGFAVNGDGGATYGPETVRHEMDTAQAGGIILAHMNHPESGTHTGALEAAADLRARGIELVHVDG